MLKPLVFTAHAHTRLAERKIRASWVEETAYDPDWTERDPNDPAVERRFRAIRQFEGRVLQVACVETPTAIRVISMMFDRNARRRS
ncbi:MAG: DUF4258 domain-containing protein [Methylacidiphilales bacterium]|nr:DUF4258 domain-containing protein [Candidatus Methylacidiphilales bacterium]